MGDFNSIPHSSSTYVLTGHGLEYELGKDIDPYQNKYDPSSEKFEKLEEYYQETKDMLKNEKDLPVIQSAYQFYNTKLI